MYLFHSVLKTATLWSADSCEVVHTNTGEFVLVEVLRRSSEGESSATQTTSCAASDGVHPELNRRAFLKGSEEAAVERMLCPTSWREGTYIPLFEARQNVALQEGIVLAV